MIEFFLVLEHKEEHMFHLILQLRFYISQNIKDNIKDMLIP